MDCRKLNAMTIKNKFSMPLVDEILDELAGTKFFASLDSTVGYHQIRMGAADEFKTDFKTHFGHYQFRVMPFGLTNAPASFQCAMNSILAPFLRKFVMVLLSKKVCDGFIDDILIYNPSWDQHLEHIRLVLAKLREHQFYVKQSKCCFGKTELSYLGHIISQHGVASDPSKIVAMENWPTPTNVTKLHGFLGLTGYYRKFVSKYGILAKLLTRLLQKKQFA
jgi:hypothetical protein